MGVVLMNNKKAMFTSQRQNWKTPKEFLKVLEKEFGKMFDPCSSKNYTNGGKIDGLKVSWKKKNFINPPYTTREQDLWLKKGFEEFKKGKLCIFLIPARTGTKRFHEIILPHAKEIKFIKGGLKFDDQENYAPFDSMIVIFDGRKR